MEYTVNSDKSKDQFLKELGELYDKHKYLRIDVKTGKQRTTTQNAALHKYCQMVADVLNERGLDFRQSLRHDVDVPWNRDLVKEYMWRPIQAVITGHNSSTQPERQQYSQIYDVLNRHLISRFNISVEWPNKD